MSGTNMTNNQAVHMARLHWIIFFWPALVLGVAGYVLYQYTDLAQPGLILGGVGVVWFLMMWATYLFSMLTIKPKQVILRKGILVRKTIDIPMNKIESIDITQSILGSILKYGTIIITGTGGTQQIMNYINRPLTCRRHIEQLMHE